MEEELIRLQCALEQAMLKAFQEMGDTANELSFFGHPPVNEEELY